MATQEQTFQLLGDAAMDRTHSEFMQQLKALQSAAPAQFPALFARLGEHTQTHFAAELAMMEASGYPALAEHRADHNRVLGEFAQFQARLDKGRQAMVRAWVNEQLPAWFHLHLATMDASLATHLAAHPASKGMSAS